MFILLALALTAQRPPPPPDGPGRWSSVKTDQTLTNELSCVPNGKFAVTLKWRFRHGLVLASIKRHGVALPQKESDKLLDALANATDLLSVQMGCIATKDASINVVYVSRESGRFSEMELVVFVGSRGLELQTPVRFSSDEGSLATDVSVPRTLEIDVELSEFTPPRRLTLDLASGGYRIMTPAGTVWPPYYPQPKDRTGTVPAPRLAAIRSAFDAALREGVGYPECESRKHRPQDLIITNAPTPVVIIRNGAQRLVAPADWSCITPAARRLQNLVDRNIEGVSP